MTTTTITTTTATAAATATTTNDDHHHYYFYWRHGVEVEHRTRDREVASSSLGRALRRKNSGQVSHTYG